MRLTDETGYWTEQRYLVVGWIGFALLLISLLVINPIAGGGYATAGVMCSFAMMGISIWGSTTRDWESTRRIE